jgi:aldose 1-epimerase
VAVTELLLSDGIAEVRLRPDLGAALASYDLVADGARRPLFRPAPPDTADAFALACNLLVPWSNRISGGGFRHRGRFFALPPNWPGEACPLHGNGFLERWEVVDTLPHSAELRLDSNGPGPFRYTAHVRCWLSEGALAMRLSVVHAGAEELPYGLGFHPWLVRTGATLLQATARDVWLEDAQHLPAGRVPIGSREAWDFSHSRPLPAGWINNAFVGWDGQAAVIWQDRGLALAIDARPTEPTVAPLATYILFSPGAEADFFCFEPVSHSVDAHNLPGPAGSNGLFVLAPGQSAAVQCRFTPYEV